jgi:hypothetical protein
MGVIPIAAKTRQGSEVMPDPRSRTELYRKVAAESSDLAKSSATEFLRRYYQGIAERYSLLAAKTSEPEVISK